MSEDRIPTHLWVEAEIRRLSTQGIGVYVVNHGDKMGGTVIQKISNLSGQCRLLIQQRDLYGTMGWVDALGSDIVEEREADAYIKRAVDRDPDLWAIEIESSAMDQSLVL